MSTHKHIDRICCVVIALVLLLTAAFMNAESFGVQAASKAKGYEDRLFNAGAVHTIDIVMDDWDSFLDTCTNEEYSLCSVVIDREAYKNVAIRAKGNTSLTQVESYGNDRYSFKIEFDHYDSTKSYYGLDKLSLNNIIQDNTYMKDFLTYRWMGSFGADAPLCSYAYITVNGEDWGLYLAVESVEEAFLERNYGSGYGELYKPDSQSMGGGRGNGGRFDMDGWQPEGAGGQQVNGPNRQTDETQESDSPADTAVPDGSGGRGLDDPPGEAGQIPNGGMMGGGKGGMGGAMGSSDVSLIYSDDEYSSYQNIFDNAKTDVTDGDKQRLIASLKQLNECEAITEVVDVEEVIRYFVVHNFVCNFDSYTGSMIHNYYLYEKDGRLSMIPWDYNLAFGGFQDVQDASALVNYPIDTPVSGGTVDSRPMLAWIFSEEEYTELYHQYFADFVSRYFDSGYFTEMIDSVQQLIAPYIEKDPTRFCTYEEFETGAAVLKEFCLLRAESVKGQLDGAIASTSDGQMQNSETLIAANIDISAMGNMNNRTGGGMNMPGGREGSAPPDGTQPQMPEQAQENGNETDAQDEREPLPSVPGDTAQGEDAAGEQQDEGAPGMPPGDEGNKGQPFLDLPDNGMRQGGETQGKAPWGQFSESVPGGQGTAEAREAESPEEWILLGVSAAVLLAGILIAVLYKKQV